MTMRRILAPVDSNTSVYEQLPSEHGLLPAIEIDDTNGDMYIGGVLVSNRQFVGLSPQADQTISGPYAFKISGGTLDVTSDVLSQNNQVGANFLFNFAPQTQNQSLYGLSIETELPNFSGTFGNLTSFFAGTSGVLNGPILTSLQAFLIAVQPTGSASFAFPEEGLDGGTILVQNYLTNSTVPAVTGLFVQTGGGGTGGTTTVDASIFIYSPEVDGSGDTMTHHYGLYIEDQTVSGGTSNPDPWAIFITGGKNDLGPHLTGVGSLAVGSVTGPTITTGDAEPPTSTPPNGSLYFGKTTGAAYLRISGAWKAISHA